MSERSARQSRRPASGGLSELPLDLPDDAEENRRLAAVEIGARGDGAQIVVDALLQFAGAWQAGNQSAALAALAAPGFTLPPQQTLQVLSNLPTVRSANIASTDAVREMQPGGDPVRR